MKKELVEDFINKLMEHISEKSSEAASSRDSHDSGFGMGSWQTAKELRDSIRKMFGIKEDK